MNASVTIRAARVTDAAALTRLIGELGYPTAPAVMAARLSALLGRARRRIRVADSAGTVCGWIEAERHLTLDADESVEIVALVVADQAQNRGVGRLLVGDIERWARETGITTLTVRSTVLGNATHPIYRHLGFEQGETRHWFVKSL